MSAARHADVAIAGAGPAGSTAALVLARRGVGVLLLERTETRPLSIGETLPPAARPMLRELGLWDRFQAGGHLPCYGNRSAWGEDGLAANDFICNPHGHGWHLDRAGFDAMLLAAAEEAGAARCRVSRVVRWEPSRAGRASGLLHVQQGRRETALRVRAVLDCTGRRAVVARGQGARRIQYDKLIAVAALHAPTAGEDDDRSTMIEAVADGWWYTALLPQERRIFVFLTDSDLLDRPAAWDAARWRARLERTRHMKQTCERANYEIVAPPTVVAAHSSRLSRCAGDGWLAAGDAALSMDPLSSQGLLNALSTGCRAAAAVFATLLGNPAATAPYAASLDRMSEEYLARKTQYYGLERRFPDSPFWRRRRAVSSMSAARPTPR